MIFSNIPLQFIDYESQTMIHDSSQKLDHVKMWDPSDIDTLIGMTPKNRLEKVCF